MALPARTLEDAPDPKTSAPRRSCRMCGAELERGSYCGSLCEEDHALYVRALQKEPASAPPQAEREDKRTPERAAKVEAVEAPAQSAAPPERSKPTKDDPGSAQLALL